MNQRVSFCYLYYGSLGPRTIRIGPHTVLKWGHRVYMSEADAMRFIADNTTIPVPKVYKAWTYKEITLIQMEYIQRKRKVLNFARIIPGLTPRRSPPISPSDLTNVCSELEGYVKQLRALVPPSPSTVSSTNGGPCWDHRIGTQPAGPFATHEDFHRFLRDGSDISQDAPPEAIALHGGHYSSKFTHGDLAPRNVLVSDGKILSIIDWDCAGWRPEYWEYTKAHFACAGTPDEWFSALKRATGDYDEHLKGEMWLWEAHGSPSSRNV